MTAMILPWSKMVKAKTSVEHKNAGGQKKHLRPPADLPKRPPTGAQQTLNTGDPNHPKVRLTYQSNLGHP